jgi:hypothetical protein
LEIWKYSKVDSQKSQRYRKGQEEKDKMDEDEEPI